MGYHSYQGGFCDACNSDLGLIEVNGGRTRHYCNSSCRQKAFQKRLADKKRNQILAYNTELRDYWKSTSIEGELLGYLKEVLINQGKEAAVTATNAALLARRIERNKKHG